MRSCFSLKQVIVKRKWKVETVKENFCILSAWLLLTTWIIAHCEWKEYIEAIAKSAVKNVCVLYRATQLWNNAAKFGLVLLLSI